MHANLGNLYILDRYCSGWGNLGRLASLTGKSRMVLHHALIPRRHVSRKGAPCATLAQASLRGPALLPHPSHAWSRGRSIAVPRSGFVTPPVKSTITADGKDRRTDEVVVLRGGVDVRKGPLGETHWELED